VRPHDLPVAGLQRWLPPLRRGAVSAADGVSIAGLAVFAVIGTAGASLQADYPHRAPDLLCYALAAAGPPTLLARRHHPVAVLLVNTLLTVVYFALDYPYGPMPLPLCIAVYQLATGSSQESRVGSPAGARGWRFRAGATLSGIPAVFGLMTAVLVAILVTEFVGAATAAERAGTAADARTPGGMPPGFLQVVPTWTITLAGPVWLGLTVRARRQQAMEAARRRAVEDRLRLARELHDVVGHSLSMISFRAGVALHVLDRRPEQARAALSAIRTASNDALGELRTTLGQLRQPGEQAAPRTPTAGLALLSTLIDDLRQAGQQIEVQVVGAPTEPPLAVDLAAYRILQEALTNVVRHAGPARATVRLAYQPEAQPHELILEVVDDGGGAAAPGPWQVGGEQRLAADRDGSARHGIAGMRERAEALGGAFHAGPQPGGGFRVWARLPLRQGTADHDPTDSGVPTPAGAPPSPTPASAAPPPAASPAAVRPAGRAAADRAGRRAERKEAP
jgi:signal transduction histidine kinase